MAGFGGSAAFTAETPDPRTDRAAAGPGCGQGCAHGEAARAAATTSRLDQQAAAQIACSADVARDRCRRIGCRAASAAKTADPDAHCTAARSRTGQAGTATAAQRLHGDRVAQAAKRHRIAGQRQLCLSGQAAIAAETADAQADAAATRTRTRKGAADRETARAAAAACRLDQNGPAQFSGRADIAGDRGLRQSRAAARSAQPADAQAHGPAARPGTRQGPADGEAARTAAATQRLDRDRVAETAHRGRMAGQDKLGPRRIAAAAGKPADANANSARAGACPGQGSADRKSACTAPAAKRLNDDGR